MIAAKVVTEVRRLLDEGVLSQRSIAQLTGVSRGSVGAIASGKRPDYPPGDWPAGDEPEEPVGPPVRCPGCGGLVYVPCRLCRVRKTLAERPRAQPRCGAVQDEERLEFNLRPEHRARYEEVCDWRREESDAENR